MIPRIHEHSASTVTRRGCQDWACCGARTVSYDDEHATGVRTRAHRRQDMVCARACACVRACVSHVVYARARACSMCV